MRGSRGAHDLVEVSQSRCLGAQRGFLTRLRHHAIDGLDGVA